MEIIKYLVIDETEPDGELECEGAVVVNCLNSSRVTDRDGSLHHLHRKDPLLPRLRRNPDNDFNLVHLAAHGAYYRKSSARLDHSAAYRRGIFRGKEVFCPDSMVRIGLTADLLVSTCCQTFNKHFLEVIRGYGKVRNYIAPAGNPFSGDTAVFSLMLYNDLIQSLAWYHARIPDSRVREAFDVAKKAYRAYGGEGEFKLYNHRGNKIYG